MVAAARPIGIWLFLTNTEYRFTYMESQASAPPANVSLRNGRGLSFAGGFLIAGGCFVLVFAGIAYFMPVFMRFVNSPYAKLIPLFSICFISFSGFITYWKRRASRPQKNSSQS